MLKEPKVLRIDGPLYFSFKLPVGLDGLEIAKQGSIAKEGQF